MTSKKYQLLSLLLILVASAICMLFPAQEESAIMDELPHIPAGYSYVRFFDYRLNPEHPPLLKALAGIPLLGISVNFPATHPSWTKDVNGQWDFGATFLYDSGNDPQQIIFLARLIPILLTLLASIIVYAWGKELMGGWWALIPAGMLALSPNILAHGHYVTTDIAAMFGVLISIFTYVSMLIKPEKKNVVFAGLAFGVAQLLKFSSVLLIPFLAFLSIAFYAGEYFRNRQTNSRETLRKWKIYFVSFLSVLVIGYFVVYLIYLLFTWNYPISRQISDTKTILQSFPNKQIASVVISMAGIPFVRPIAHYILGVFMVMQRATGGNTGYFLGELSNLGWWFYFPVIFFFKETIPALLLIGAGFTGAIIRIAKNKNGLRSIPKRFAEYLGTNFAEFAMLSFIVLYWGYSMKSNLNIGVRHLFPTIPLFYLLAIGSVKKMMESGKSNILLSQKSLWGVRAKKIIFVLLVVWLGVETALAFPYFTSYFNEFAGGKWNGYRIATDSNYDWGQDLLRLKKWQKENGNPKIAVDYFGGGNPHFVLGENMVAWSSEKGNPKNEGIQWIAVSVNTLSQAMSRPIPSFYRDPKNGYEFLRERTSEFTEGSTAIPAPDARAGTSIFIYKLTE